MLVSYEPGSVFLEKKWKSRKLKNCRLLVLFLGTDYDRDFLVEVLNLGHDLNNLLREDICIGVLFMPPEERMSQEKLEEFADVFGTIDENKIVKLGRHMSEESYVLADSLGIPYADLPAIVFLSASEPERVAYISLRRSSFRAVYRDIRKLLGDWYADYRPILDGYINRRGGPIAVDVLDEIEQKLITSEKGRTFPKKIKGAIAYLKNAPRYNYSATRLVEQLLEEKGLEFELSGVPVNYKNFRDVFDRQIEERLPPLPPFDLDRVARLGRVIRFKAASKTALEFMSENKGLLGWLKFVRWVVHPF